MKRAIVIIAILSIIGSIVAILMRNRVRVVEKLRSAGL